MTGEVEARGGCMGKRADEEKAQQAKRYLLDPESYGLTPGQRVYTVLRHVSKSGMQRQIDVFVISKDGRPCRISHLVRDLCGYRWNRENCALIVNGCGTDMGFEVVYNLGRKLWGAGFPCAGEELCRSNDHSNGDRTYGKQVHTDGGYALRQEWI